MGNISLYSSSGLDLSPDIAVAAWKKHTNKIKIVILDVKFRCLVISTLFLINIIQDFKIMLLILN